VVLKVISVASPRISGKALAFEDVDGLMVKNVSRKVWIWNVPGVSVVGIARKDSSGEIASVVADGIPYLSHPKYLRS
jgi:hypothetical protein